MWVNIKKIGDSVLGHYSLFGIRGVLRRLLISLTCANNEFEAMIPNSSRRVLIRLRTTDGAVFHKVFIENEYDLALAQDPSIIVDAGANVGMTAVYFALRYPNARIIAIEPESENFGILKSNAKRFP